MKVSVQRWGNSLALRIPKAVATETDLTDGAVVNLTFNKGKIVLTPEREVKFKLEDLLSKITKANR